MTDAAGWHGTRTQALSFGAVADGYERVRPGYPEEVARWAFGDRPCRVVDVGAGTGKWTRVVRGVGHDVVAVEPDPDMRARLGEVLPDVEVLPGTGEALPLADGSVDAVTFAQSWHWVDPEAGSAEAARVLRRDGHLVLVWNRRDPEAPFTRAVAATVTDVEPGLLERSSADSSLLAEVPRLRGPLVHEATLDVRDDVPLSVDDAVALAATWSYVALSAARDDLLDGLRERLEGLADQDRVVSPSGRSPTASVSPDRAVAPVRHVARGLAGRPSACEPE